MKNLLQLVILLFIISNISFAQTKEKKYEIVYDLIQDNYKVASEYNYNIQNSYSKTIDRSFYETNDYCVIAVPTSSGVTDTDLYIQFESGNDYVKNDGSNTWAMVKFTPSYTRTMRIKVVNRNSSSSSASYNFDIIVLYKSKNSK
jgi:hypothetical protein